MLTNESKIISATELAFSRLDKFNSKMTQFNKDSKKMQKQQKSYELSNSIFKMMKDIDRITAPVKSLQSASGYLTSLNQHSKHLSFINRVLAPQRQFLEDLAKLKPPISPLLFQLSSSSSGVFLSKLLTEHLEIILPKLGALSSEHLQKISELTVEFNSEVPNVTASDIHEFSLALESVNAQADTNNEFFSVILKLKPIFMWILFYALPTLLLSYTYDVLKEQVSLPLLSNHDAQTKTEVIARAKVDLCIEHLRLCKFVFATELNVRTEGNQKASVIDTLKFGQGVFVVEKDDSRSWSYVEYFDHKTQKNQSGWVYSRYLKRYVP